MKANSLEELVANSNILGDLRNHTDWYDRLVKFAQRVADWQKERMLEDAIPFYEILKAVPSFERENTRIIIVNEEE